MWKCNSRGELALSLHYFIKKSGEITFIMRTERWAPLNCQVAFETVGIQRWKPQFGDIFEEREHRDEKHRWGSRRARETLVKAPLIIAARSRVYQAIYKYDRWPRGNTSPWVSRCNLCAGSENETGRKSSGRNGAGAIRWRTDGRTSDRGSIWWKCSRAGMI